MLDDVKAAMEGKLRSMEEKAPLGKAEVKAQFGSGAAACRGGTGQPGRHRMGALASCRAGGWGH